MRASVSPVDELNAPDRQAMFRLLDRCFAGVTRPTFDADLTAKSHAVLIHDESDELVGFSTLSMYHAPDPDGRPATVVCSGDTIVVPEAWGSWTLPRRWIRAVHDLHECEGTGDLYWLLICSGFRTFRFLPVFTREYVVAAEPKPERALNARLWRWMQELSVARWGGRFDADAGLVRFEAPQTLRPELIDITPGRESQRHVRRFIEFNPGHDQGDELVCLASLSWDNLTAAGRRMLVGTDSRAGIR